MDEIISSIPGEPRNESLDSYEGVIMNVKSNIWGWKPEVNFNSRIEPEWSDVDMSLGQLAYELKDVGTLVKVKNGKYEVMGELYEGW